MSEVADATAPAEAEAEATTETTPPAEETKSSKPKGKGKKGAKGAAKAKPKTKSDRQRILESAVKAILKAEKTEDREAGQLTRKELDQKVRVEVKRTTGPSKTVGNAANAGVRTKVNGKTYRFVRVAPSTYGVEEVDEAAE